MDARIGKRVQLHPATDEWMMGDRYGEVVGLGQPVEYVGQSTRERSIARPIRVKLDKSGRVRRFHPNNVIFID